MIAIVGGGWFGCHIARSLKLRGIPFELFEAKPELFQGASGYNQNRLHLGFHYPRSAKTRKQSAEGFHAFIDVYSQLSAPVAMNLYAVTNDSLIDFFTYKRIMDAGSRFFDEVTDHGLANVEGCIRCDERVVLTNKAREYFTQELIGHLRLGEAFSGDDSYEVVINCTYQAWNALPGRECVYEPCATLLYASKERQAITLMDGQFCSIYPYEGDLHTLYSVNHSRLERCETYERAASRLAYFRADDAELRFIRTLMEDQVSHYVPWFRERYEYAGWHSAIRCIPVSRCDARDASVVRDGNVIHVMPGKIDSIFHAEREVMKCLGLV